MMAFGELPVPLQQGFVAAFGLVLGSFLNAAIHRLPDPNLSLLRPLRSFCPRCQRSLTWSENLPVLSWVLQAGRCRGCRQPISVRYPLVEILTAGLFLLAYNLGPRGPAGPQLGLLLIWWLVLAGLIVATFVDFDCWEIPDEVSLGGMWISPLLSFLVPALHRDSPVARWFTGEAEVDRIGAVLTSLTGIAAGYGVLWLIETLGPKLYGRDAMGHGDTKLLAAGGGFVGPGGALVALLLGACIASVAGLLNILRFTCLSGRRAQRRGGRRSLLQALRSGRIAGRYLPFGPYLGMGVGFVLLDWETIRDWLP
jgi:leader peptidase (prepilin peptidase) / N-methyltransferase